MSMSRRWTPSSCAVGSRSVEALRRTVEAVAVAAAGVVDRSNPFRAQGFLSTKTVVKHMCRLSGPEAHRRVQTARLHQALPEWADAEADGRVGVAQCELMARVALVRSSKPSGAHGRPRPAHGARSRRRSPTRAAIAMSSCAPRAADVCTPTTLSTPHSSVTCVASSTTARAPSSISAAANACSVAAHARRSCCCSSRASGSVATDPLRGATPITPVGWKAHGATVPRNGGGLCHGHNHLKEQGFQVYRDDHGTWHVIDPDGNEVV